MKTKKITRKLPAKKQDIKQLQARIADLTHLLQRTQADFENFRKRTENEKIQLKKIANEELIFQLLPILDNFERSLAQIPENNTQQSWKKGVELIYRMLLNTLKEFGLKQIIVQPKTLFNPNFHEAVARAKNPQFKPGEIIETLQTGYQLADKIIRPSKVKVAE